MNRPSGKARILIVEDDCAQADALIVELQEEGFEAHAVHDGLAGLAEARRNAPDLILLDVDLPGINGLAFCERLRRTTDVPIILMSGQAPYKDVRSRVQGLDAGANDYMMKPVDFDELLARVRVQLRQRSPAPCTRFSVGEFELDTASHEVSYRGSALAPLPRKEFQLLAYLFKHRRHVKTHVQILDEVWGLRAETIDATLTQTIYTLRQRLEADGRPRVVHTVIGVGYVAREDEAK
jgi:DNA-binding response OmpR family regulator